MLMIACLMTTNLFATDYYFAGAANSWSNNNEAYKFVEVEGVLTLEIANLYGEFKITEGGQWHPQHGAINSGDKLHFKTPYNLNKCNGSSDVPNMGIDGTYTNAKLTLVEDNGNLTIKLVEGKAKYYLVGAFNGWSLESAVEFVEVNDVLTANVSDLSGTFKVIQDRDWSNQWATNWETGAGLAFGEPYILGAKGAAGTSGDPANLSLANPFGGYQNAVLTLEVGENATMTLTLTEGDLVRAENDWYVPGVWNDWKCNDAAKMSAVLGQENTYSLEVAEMSGAFKIVYGEWAVEFGANNNSDTWTVNVPYTMTYPAAGNLNPASADTYKDATITIVVDYDNATVQVQVSADTTPTGVENISIKNDGKYYDVLGRQIATPQKGNLYIHNGKKVLY